MIELGKYTTTVLSAYGISGLLIVGLIVQSVLRNARARRALEAQETRMKEASHG
ncbi:MAG: heme exporter protein CcmD [Paracoccus sp. (in: a-proteobacteria)]|uniref:heme exporter protein CcmD n=1 Tax=Paracoccus sp. TaxID=267 RepID=UPI0026DFF31C|nr:heme exporter protein CcmD [Paracoccus sp. (in: a-proteobacteria)]MDO5620124.1 heme exporter protein CcmD [Paracoccus sp. (in: a-proteobacteria)]